MSVSFEQMLSPASRVRLASKQREMSRLYSLSNLWLGAAILRLARQVREEMPLQLGDPQEQTYDASFVWHVVPNIAKRLGVRTLLINENRRDDIATSQGQEYRELIGVYLKNLSMGRFSKDADRTSLCASELLGGDLANGNPIAMALDRLVPAPAPDCCKNDWAARYLLEISAVRGFKPTPHWSPRLQHKAVHPQANNFSNLCL